MWWGILRKNAVQIWQLKVFLLGMLVVYYMAKSVYFNFSLKISMRAHLNSKIIIAGTTTSESKITTRKPAFHTLKYDVTRSNLLDIWGFFIFVCCFGTSTLNYKVINIMTPQSNLNELGDCRTNRPQYPQNHTSIWWWRFCFALPPTSWRFQKVLNAWWFSSLSFYLCRPYIGEFVSIIYDEMDFLWKVFLLE